MIGPVMESAAESHRLIRPLPLDRISRSELGLTNIWHRRWSAEVPDIAGLPLRVGPAIPSDGPHDTPLDRLGLSIGGLRCDLALPKAVTDRLLIALSAPPRDELSDTSLLLLIELATAPLLDAIEARSGMSIELSHLHPDSLATAGPGLGLSGTLGASTFVATLHWPAEHPEALAALIGAPTSDIDDDVSIIAAFRLGATRLTIGELASLRVGDALLVEDHADRDGDIAVVFGGRRFAVASLSGQRAVLQSPPRPISDDVSRLRTTLDLKDMSDDPTVSAELDDLEITLLFEIGRLSVPLGSLRTLAPGHVFDLGQDPKTAVDILAGDRRVGRGEVIQIGDTVGVRIVRMFDRD
ncbi:type III secretion system cytoplasmic ring protein SctQ [Bradyrhizobium sp. USDA 4353]